MASTIKAEGAKELRGLTGGAWSIPLSQVEVPEQNPARFSEPPKERFDEFYQEFMKLGYQHTPARVQLLADKRVRLMDGKQRYKALLRKEQETGVPQSLLVTLFKGNDEEAFAEAVSANKDKIPPTPIDEAFQIRRWRNEFHKSTKEIAEKYGKSEAWVTQRESLLSLPKDKQKLIHQGFLETDAGLIMTKILGANPDKLDETLQVAAEIETKKTGKVVEIPTAESKPSDEQIIEAVNNTPPAADSAPESPKKGSKKKAGGSISSTSLLQAAAQTGALGTSAPQMKMPEFMKYIDEYVETSLDGDPGAKFWAAVKKFIQRKIDGKKMDKITVEMIGSIFDSQGNDKAAAVGGKGKK